jgi:hypothetical protein
MSSSLATPRSNFKLYCRVDHKCHGASVNIQLQILECLAGPQRNSCIHRCQYHSPPYNSCRHHRCINSTTHPLGQPKHSNPTSAGTNIPTQDPISPDHSQSTQQDLHHRQLSNGGLHNGSTTSQGMISSMQEQDQPRQM